MRAAEDQSLKEVRDIMKWKNLQMPKNVEVDDKVSTNQYGKFSIEPLERGFGVTLGNALRRAPRCRAPPSRP